MSIETNYDTKFVASLALREKQIQQNYRPIIAVHKWFARRPGTLFRSLILSEFADAPLEESFYDAHDLAGVTIADPFMGGGTVLFEANRVGCDVIGCDINPMAYWVVREELAQIDLDAYHSVATDLMNKLKLDVGHSYHTRCKICGSQSAEVKYFLWVKQAECPICREVVDLFPGYQIAQNRRHPRHVLVCPECGELNEVDNLSGPGNCGHCDCELKLTGPAQRNRCICPNCGTKFRYPAQDSGVPQHRMFAIEYHCSRCKEGHKGRFFKKPGMSDLQGYEWCEAEISKMSFQFVPEEAILPGDESNRLLRWGYRKYREMFNSRQIRGLELSAQYIATVQDRRVRQALITNLSDLLRYQNMICRYDTMALKSLDIFSVHGFPVGLVQCESNIIGIENGKGQSVGSGGWTNIISKYSKAKAYCDTPFEIRFLGKRKEQIFIDGEWIGEGREGSRSRGIQVSSENATSLPVEAGSIDAVFTDPPYFGNVQYGELMEFCFVWVRRLAEQSDSAMQRHSSRDELELTGNQTLRRGLDYFTEGLSQAFQHLSHALKPGAPFVFTYHHNKLDAYVPIAVAILDAGLVCSATLACPAEMGGSIHINGTGSSILDTVFVCRHSSVVKLPNDPSNMATVAGRLRGDLEAIRKAGHNPTNGDINCLVLGYLTSGVVAELAHSWDKSKAVGERMRYVMAALERGPRMEDIENSVDVRDVFQLPLFGPVRA